MTSPGSVPTLCGMRSSFAQSSTALVLHHRGSLPPPFGNIRWLALPPKTLLTTFKHSWRYTPRFAFLLQASPHQRLLDLISETPTFSYTSNRPSRADSDPFENRALHKKDLNTLPLYRPKFIKATRLQSSAQHLDLEFLSTFSPVFKTSRALLSLQFALETLSEEGFC